MSDAPPEPPKRKRGRPRKPEHEKAPELSGAAKRKAKHEAADFAEQQARDAAGFPQDNGKWAEDFQAAGSPDLENPETDLAYTRKLQLIVLKQMATTPFPTVAQKNTWARIREMSATVGMTSSRAALEATVKKLRKQLEERAQAATVTEVAGGSITKPPTARGGQRGPRPLPPDPPPEPPASS